MKRLLLIFIVIGNILPLLHALPSQEENLKKSENKHDDIISLYENLKNYAADAHKKSGRTIHQNENNENDPNSLEKEAVQLNSTKNMNSWDLPHLLKLLLNLLHDREEDKTEEIVKSGKNYDGSKNKSHKSNAETTKAGRNVQKKQEKNTEINSFGTKNKNTKEITNSKPIDAFSSLKFDSEKFSKIEHLIDEINLQESKINETIDEDDYYDDDVNDDDEYCDDYYSSSNSEKASTPETILSEIVEDSYEAGGIEITDEDYLNLDSETTSKLISEVPTENNSYSSVNQNETIIQDEIINQETKEFYDDTILSNKVSINDEKEAKNEISKQYPVHDTTSIRIQSENNLKYDNAELDILSSSESNEINILEIETISPEQNVILSTKNDRSVLEKSEFQNNNTYITSSYRPLMESTVFQEVSDQSLISFETPTQSTTSLIPDVGNLSTNNTELQTQINDQLMQETTLQKTSLNTESVQSDSFLKQHSFDEEFLVAKTSDTIQVRKTGKKNFTTQAENNSINNQETTQELLQSLPLSSSGEYISNTFEKDQKHPITSKTAKKLSYTSEKDRQLSVTSEVNKQLSKTSESNRELSNISESEQQLSNTSGSNRKISSISERGQLSIISESEQQLSNISESEQQLSNTSETNRQLSNISKSKQQHSNTSGSNREISSISENEQQLSNTSETNNQLSNISESKQQLSNTSGSDKHISNISESEQLSNISESEQQISNISENEQQLSNISENNKQLLLLETDSKSTILENSELQKKSTEDGQEENQSKSSNSSYTLTTIQERIPNPLQNVTVSENKKSLFSTENAVKDLAPDKTLQITSNTDYQQDVLEKDNSDFSTSQVTIILNNEANENINQNGDSLQVNEVLNPVSDLSVTHGRTSKNMEDTENDDEYYELDVGSSSVNSKFVNDENSLESIKTSQMNKESDQNNINLLSEPEKPYETLLQFLYEHSNSSLLQSLKENEM